MCLRYKYKQYIEISSKWNEQKKEMALNIGTARLIT